MEEKEERYLYKDAADISCRVLIHLMHMESGIRNLVCGNLLLTSLQPIWHPCPPLPFLLFLVMTHHGIVTLFIGILINTFNHLAAIIVEILFTIFACS